jgi:hypothetical protein
MTLNVSKSLLYTLKYFKKLVIKRIKNGEIFRLFLNPLGAIDKKLSFGYSILSG